MNGRLDVTELLFSSAGRLSRAPFIATGAVLILLAWLCEAVAPGVLAFLVDLFLLFCGAAITSKRLHDRGRTGWWAAIVLLALAAVWNPSQSLLKFPAWMVLAWSAIELCAMPGEQGSNRFGPNPHRPVPA